MVKVLERYKCEKCPAIFEDRQGAEEHEQIPLNELPEGFVFFHPHGDAEVIGKRSGVNRSDHDAIYSRRYTLSFIGDSDEIEGIELHEAVDDWRKT